MRVMRPFLTCVILVVAAAAVANAENAVEYREGQITAWHKAGRNVVLGGPLIGAPGQSGADVTAVGMRTNVFDLRSGEMTYEFHSPRQDFKVGDHVKFRVKDQKLFIALKAGKEARFEIVGMKKQGTP
jgi:hypothetical protein